ncbi:MAG: hypothetical protein UH654_00730 [Lachnospiraceae bacterium]|nr:hypothetical protein [Lachnospiraceae bacterium]
MLAIILYSTPFSRTAVYVSPSSTNEGIYILSDSNVTSSFASASLSSPVTLPVTVTSSTALTATSNVTFFAFFVIARVLSLAITYPLALTSETL